MTIITMPDELMSFAELRFNLVTVNVLTAASPFNPLPRVTGPSAEYWQVEMVLTPLRGDDFDAAERFLSNCRGGKNQVRIYDRRRVAGNGRTQPQGSGGLTSTINVAVAVAAGAEGATLKNLTTSQAIALKAMDQFQVGNNLYRVQDSTSSDSGGQATVSFRPAARHGWAVDDAVTLVKPAGLFRLVSGDLDFGVGSGPLISRPLSLSFREDPDVVA